MKWNKRLQAPGLVGLLLVGLVSCKGGDPNQTKLTFMPDMADVPIAKPQREYLDPPVGSVTMGSILYPKTDEEAAKTLQNPLVGQDKEDEYRKEGAYLFAQVCIACHGPEAKGDGKVTDKFPRPPDITSDLYAAKADGFFFHKITFGSAIMPPQGDKLDPLERWKIVLHLRTLQGSAAQKQQGTQGNKAGHP